MKPGMIVPARDLKGATPEKLARALLRPRGSRKSVVRDQVPKQEAATDKPDDRAPHLVEGV